MPIQNLGASWIEVGFSCYQRQGEAPSTGYKSMILRCLALLMEGSQQPRQRAIVGNWAHRDFARLPSSRSSNARSVGAQLPQTSKLQKRKHLWIFTNSCGKPKKEWGNSSYFSLDNFE